jgi:hypothetical protein
MCSKTCIHEYDGPVIARKKVLEICSKNALDDSIMLQICLRCTLKHVFLNMMGPLIILRRFLKHTPKILKV